MKNKKWVVKNTRPEETLEDARLYYTDEEVEKYTRSGGMRRAQEKIAYRVIELLNLKKNHSILDLGSGPGFTAEIYRKKGYKVTCLDLIPRMIEKAKEKNFKSYVGDMKEIEKLFSKEKFDCVVSVSALQWIKDKKDLKKIAQGIYFVLKKDSPVVIQFYPKSEKELEQTARVFSKNGFKAEIVIDWPNVPKNRTIYLVLKKLTQTGSRKISAALTLY